MEGCDTFPSPLEVDRELYIAMRIMNHNFNKFPSPLEVVRYLYKMDSDDNYGLAFYAFPAPREVDRYLYENTPWNAQRGDVFIWFPAPREVDRYLYALKEVGGLDAVKKFPSPLEVDR